MHRFLLPFVIFACYLCAACLPSFAEEIPLDGTAKRIGGTSYWFYSPETVRIAGKDYQGFGYIVDGGTGVEKTITLDVRGYERFTAFAGLSDGWKKKIGAIKIKVNGKVILNKTLNSGNAAIPINVALSNATSLTITMRSPILLAHPIMSIKPAEFNADPPTLLWQKPTLTGDFAYSPDGNCIAIAQSFGTIAIYRASDFTLMKTLQIDGEVTSVTYSPNGKWLATAGNIITIWKVFDYSLARTIPQNRVYENPIIVTFSPDSQWLASIGEVDELNIWRVSDGKLHKTLNFGKLANDLKVAKRVTFSPDGKWLAVQIDYPYVQVWNAADYSLVASFATGSYGCYPTFTPDSQTLVTLDQGKKVFETRSPKDNFSQCEKNDLFSVAARKLNLYIERDTGDYYRYIIPLNQSTSISGKAYSPEGKWFAEMSGDKFGIKMTSCTNGKPDGEVVRNHQVQVGQFYGLAFSADNQWLASQSGEGLRIWRVKDGACIKTLNQTIAYGSGPLAFSIDGKWLAQPAYKAISLWNTASGICEKTLPLEIGNDTATLCLLFSPDGKYLASCYSNGKIYIWKVADWALALTLDTKYQSSRMSISFSPDSSLLASPGINGSITLWRVADGACVKTSDTLKVDGNPLVFTKDGKMILNSRGELWRIADEKIVASYPAIGSSRFYLSPENKWLMTGGSDSNYDGLLRIYHLPDAISELEFRQKGLGVVAISPNGKYIAFGGRNGLRLMKK